MTENLSVLLWHDLFSKCTEEWILHFIKTLYVTEHSHIFRSKPYYWKLCLIFILTFLCICLRPSCLSPPSQMANNSFVFCTVCILRMLSIRNRPFRSFQVLYISWHLFYQVIFYVVFCSTVFSSHPSTFFLKAGNRVGETPNVALLTLVFLLAVSLNIANSPHLTATP